MPYQQATDEQLIRYMSAGDNRAFAELYRRYGNRMHGYFYRMLGQDVIKAEDFTQELFLKIIEKVDRFDLSASFRTWIYTIAANMVKNEYRRMGRHPQTHPLETAHAVTAPQQTIDGLEQEVLIGQVFKALQLLDEVHRDCFVLRYQEGLNIREISEILQCPPGTVKSRIHYAVKKLNKLLQTTFSNCL